MSPSPSKCSWVSRSRNGSDYVVSRSALIQKDVIIMKRTLHLATAVGVWLALASPVLAQQATESAAPETAATEAASPSDPAARDDKEAADRDTAIKESWTKGRPISMQYIRPQDKRGLNVFE